MTPTAPRILTVFYDGACPLCRREIAFYQSLDGAETVRWVDVARAEAMLPAGLTRAQVLARFHVAIDGSTVVSGARGFIALWQALPRFAWAARLLDIPPLPHLLEVAYRVSLIVRPWMQRLARRGDTGTACNDAICK